MRKFIFKPQSVFWVLMLLNSAQMKASPAMHISSIGPKIKRGMAFIKSFVDFAYSEPRMCDHTKSFQKLKNCYEVKIPVDYFLTFNASNPNLFSSNLSGKYVERLRVELKSLTWPNQHGPNIKRFKPPNNWADSIVRIESSSLPASLDSLEATLDSLKVDHDPDLVYEK